jgi:phosphatidate phosphatase PAH1
MLYIDQPVQVGLSYDVLTNITLNLADEGGTVEVADFSDGVPEQNNTFYVGKHTTLPRAGIDHSPLR